MWRAGWSHCSPGGVRHPWAEGCPGRRALSRPARHPGLQVLRGDSGARVPQRRRDPHQAVETRRHRSAQPDRPAAAHLHRPADDRDGSGGRHLPSGGGHRRGGATGRPQCGRDPGPLLGPSVRHAAPDGEAGSDKSAVATHYGGPAVPRRRQCGRGRRRVAGTTAFPSLTGPGGYVPAARTDGDGRATVRRRPARWWFGSAVGGDPTDWRRAAGVGRALAAIGCRRKMKRCDRTPERDTRRPPASAGPGPVPDPK